MTTPQDLIDKAIEETTAALSDGLDIADLAVLIRNGIQIAEQLDDVPPEDKRALALHYAAELLDQFWTQATPKMQAAIKEVDIPWVPEGFETAVLDPIIAKYAPKLLRHFAMQAIPQIVDLVVDASKGGVQVNTELWTKAGSVLELLEKHGETLVDALRHGEDVPSLEPHAVNALAALRELL